MKGNGVVAELLFVICVYEFPLLFVSPYIYILEYAALNSMQIVLTFVDLTKYVRRKHVFSPYPVG